MKNAIRTYKVNGTATTRSLAAWFFGTKFLKEAEATARHEGCPTAKFFQAGTGYLTIEF